MKKLLLFACLLATFSLAANSVSAENIAGKLGVTAKIGVLFPADGDLFNSHNNTDAGVVGGGGLLYGIDNHFAADIDVTRTSVSSDATTFGVTNLSLGAQYRFALNQPQLVPYVGTGLDILLNDADRGYRVDNTVGVHAAAGVDFFLTKKLALTAEAKLLVAPDVDIHNASGKVGNFDPTAISSTVGVRYFFN